MEIYNANGKRYTPLGEDLLRATLLALPRHSLHYKEAVMYLMQQGLEVKGLRPALPFFWGKNGVEFILYDTYIMGERNGNLLIGVPPHQTWTAKWYCFWGKIWRKIHDLRTQI